MTLPTIPPTVDAAAWYRLDLLIRAEHVERDMAQRATDAAALAAQRAADAARLSKEDAALAAHRAATVTALTRQAEAIERNTQLTAAALAAPPPPPMRANDDGLMADFMRSLAAAGVAPTEVFAQSRALVVAYRTAYPKTIAAPR